MAALPPGELSQPVWPRAMPWSVQQGLQEAQGQAQSREEVLQAAESEVVQLRASLSEVQVLVKIDSLRLPLRVGLRPRWVCRCAGGQAAVRLSELRVGRQQARSGRTSPGIACANQDARLTSQSETLGFRRRALALGSQQAPIVWR
jgi:hypothetical protein